MVQSNSAHALARDELVRVLTAYSGVTTADGNLLGTSLIDSNLVGKNDFLTGKTILIMSGDAVNEDRGGQSFNPATGEVTVPSAYTDKNGNPVQIPAGTLWRVLNISSVEINVADLEALMGTPADPPGTTTVFAWLSKIFSNTSFFADLIEGVYLDTSGGGTPGTTYPIGSAGVPSSNLTDAFAIMATRHSNQLRLVGGSTDAPVTLTFTTPVDIELVGGQGYAVVFNHGGLTSDIKGDVTVASLTVTDGSLTIRGNCHAVFVQNDGTGDVLIEESCFSSNGGVANGGSGNIRVEIDCHCEGVSINNSGAGIIMIDGDVYGGVINDGTNMILIGGNVFAEVSAIQCTSTGSIQIDGDVHVHYAVIDPGPSSSIFIGGDCDAARSGIQSDGTSSIIICGRCQADNISNNGTGLTRIYGDTSVLNGDVHNFSTGLIEMFADCFINGGITNESAGTIEIMGNSRAQSVSNNGNNGNIHIHGDMYMNDSATLLNGGGGTAAISVDGDFFGSNTAIENDLEGSIGIGGDCFAREIDNVSTGVAGGISIGGNTFVGIGVNDSSTGGFTYFGGSVDSSSGIVVNGSGSLTVSRNCTTSTLVQGGAGGSIIVRGDLEVPFGISQTAAGTILVTGESRITVPPAGVAIDNAVGGVITLVGSARIYGIITNLGTLTYRGRQLETGVNITAIVASETDFLNLAPLTSPGDIHYTVDDLVLKSADPGLNKVYVRLYKLVNGVLTAINVDTAHPNGFEITTANFDLYFNLMDMFGLHHLSGDEIKITVQASAGGPYAVTGSYSWRSE